MKKLITITGICAAMALPALAGPDGADKSKGEKGKGKGKGRPNPEQVFKHLDTDESGGISLEEYKAGPMAKRAKDPSKVDERFKKIDGDGDGIVSQTELTASFKKMAEMRGKGGKGGKGGKPGAPGKGGNRPPRPDSDS